MALPHDSFMQTSLHSAWQSPPSGQDFYRAALRPHAVCTFSASNHLPKCVAGMCVWVLLLPASGARQIGISTNMPHVMPMMMRCTCMHQSHCPIARGFSFLDVVSFCFMQCCLQALKQNPSIPGANVCTKSISLHTWRLVFSFFKHST